MTSVSSLSKPYFEEDTLNSLHNGNKNYVGVWIDNEAEN